MNGLQTLPQWKTFFGNPEGAILGMMNAVYPLGKVVALFVVTYISDRYGRKIPIFIGLVCCVGFAIMQALSQSLPTFVTARALLGFFTSFISQPSPVLITELAYPTQRGKITALYNTFFVRSVHRPIRVLKLGLTSLIVLWCDFCCMVYLWHLQAQFYVELENSVSTPGRSACFPTTWVVFPSRVS